MAKRTEDLRIFKNKTDFHKFRDDVHAVLGQGSVKLKTEKLKNGKIILKKAEFTKKGHDAFDLDQNLLKMFPFAKGNPVLLELSEAELNPIALRILKAERKYGILPK